MKTEFKTIAKDNITTAAVLAATFVTIVGAVLDSTDAFADHSATQLPLQRMETITVSASREDIAKLDTILITATREAKFLVTPN